MPLHNKRGNELPQSKGARSAAPPVVLIKWYDWTKWLLERVDSFSKNQRFVLGQRLADRAIDVLELLVAERMAALQSARIGVAEAEFYPPIAITGIIGVNAQNFSDLFNS
jgi:hypothetical protein